ncbi:MAG: CDP-alcohol phosphatidyltransferase family protein [Anaerolineales bacterium]
MNNSAHHTRVNDILLGRLERPALKWLAVHSPKWVTPDIYTAIGVLGSVITFVGYILSRLNPGCFWLATFGFLVNWYGDSLDGTLARYRHIERPVYGYFVDHITDAITQVFILIGLGLSPYVSFNMACLALVAFLLMCVLVYLRTYVVGEFKISYGMLGPTEARVIGGLLNTAMFFFGKQIWHVKISFLGNLAVNPYDVTIGIVTLLLLYFFLTTAFKESIRLAKAGH